MKILWHSAPPLLSTGYGTQSKLMIRKLKQMGHELAISCTVGCPGATLSWEGIPMFPDSGYSGKHGFDMVANHAREWKADVVISWIDAFAIPPEVASKIGKWCAWVPVDSEPLMIMNVPALKACKWSMAPTQWGQRMLKESGLDDAMYLPCAHDPQVFYPMADQDAARKEFGKMIGRDLTGKWLVNVVSNNAGGRKNFQAIFDAWRTFSSRHADALLYLHTDMTGYYNNGNDLAEMVKAYGIDLNAMIIVNQWKYATGQINEAYLNLMYNASNCHLNCCYGEGFGLPIMDAQAAGCPTLVPAFAAADEIGLCYKISVGERYATLPGAMQFMVSPAEVVKQMELAYENRDTVNRLDISRETRIWQIDHVADTYLKPVLAKMEAGL